MKHQSAHDRVLTHMNKGKEPKGHCEAVNNRNIKGLEIADKNFKKELKDSK